MADFSAPKIPPVLIAVDKFKGSLSGVELSEAISVGLKRVLGDSFNLAVCPIADGGDGTVDAALSAGFDEVKVPVIGPLGEEVLARFAFNYSSSVAVIEIAEACGLRLIPTSRLDTWNATSFGVGELILAALDRGAQEIILGLGGSATTDAGAGMLQTLGAQILDDDGASLTPGGGALAEVGSVDVSTLDQRLSNVRMTIASDVTNPLLGVEGAVVVYGPQKGATYEQIPMLEQGIKRFAYLLELALNVSRETFSSKPGAGAAGGLGFAALALGAEMHSGVEICFDFTGFYQALEKADIVITGEGKLDSQTLQGKGPAGVARAAHSKQKRTFAICGANDLTPAQTEAAGFEQVFAVLDLEENGQRVTLQQSLNNPRHYVERLGEELARYLADNQF